MGKNYMDELQTRIELTVSENNVLIERVTSDDVWKARKRMEELWWRQCRVCDFPGWTQEQKDAITEQAIKAQREYYRLNDLYWQQEITSI
jgi:hypothetical protein